ncbi:MAG TPA: peptidase M15 [Pseudonocardiaceae bacterium]|nr:peptidase M15 [Pseudonocardiaceae bacterium]
MRPPASKPAVARTSARLLLITALLAVAGLVGTPTVAVAAGCPGQAAPPPAVDSSEVLAPGQLSPTPLPEPATAAGGPRMGQCGFILPTGAPPLPKDLGFQSWMITDLDTGAVLAAKDPHARERPASLIKLLLSQVVARHLNPNKPVTGTQADANQPGTRVGVGPGGHYTVGMLVKALLMASGNDCAHALAMQLGGMQAAVDQMNALAHELGATDTRAASPSGLDAPGMTSSAYDLSIFFKVDMATPLLANAMHTVQMPFPGYGNKPGYKVNNDNLLLRTFPGDMGGKVGYTTDAQQTYANAAARDGHHIAVVMTRGTNHIVGRWQNARELMNYGFALESAHAAPVGYIVSPLAAGGATTANNVVKQATATPTGNAQVSAVPTTSMTTFGNVGLPLTILAAIALVLIGLLYLRRQKARKARAAAAARVASAETVRVAVPPDLAARARPKPKPVPDDADAITQSLPAAVTRPRPPTPAQGTVRPAQPMPRAPRPSTPTTPRPASRPSTTPSAPEWPTGPEWPT